MDAAMRELSGYPMGPCELLDLIGIDTCVEILKTIHADTNLEIDEPAAGMVKLVASGNKGRKSGSGFYGYSEKLDVPTDSNEGVKNQVHNDLLIAYLGDCIAMEATGYATKADIDFGMKLGCGLPKGPFEVIEGIGIENVRSAQAELSERTGVAAYQPLPLQVIQNSIQNYSMGRRNRREPNQEPPELKLGSFGRTENHADGEWQVN